MKDGGSRLTERDGISGDARGGTVARPTRPPGSALELLGKALLLLAACVLSAGLGGWARSAIAQQPTSATTAGYTGLATLDLGDDLESTGAGTAVEVPWLGTARLQVVFSSADGSNDVDIEGSVDGGTTYHLLDDTAGNPATLTADGYVDVAGPLTHIRANVQGLGTEITVDINGRGTVRR